MVIGGKEFKDSNKTYIMGILNVTPDSFSDGGKWNCLEKAVSHASAMIEEGADLIDIGGESTRPGYTQISDKEEIGRIVPVIKEITKRFDIPVSIDTYKSTVARAALEAGASLVNDIWGLKYDSEMAGVIADSGGVCCLMHNRREAKYSSFMEDLLEDMRETVEIAGKAGIKREKIILDPGIGFGKTYELNLEAIRHLERLKELGFPLLLGTSRKSVIGLTLGASAEDRLEGTIATSVMAVWKGCSFIRVHDVKENKRAVQMTEAILYGKR